MQEAPTGAWRAFRFRRLLGSGGFGEVYEAELSTQSGFSRLVAVKLLREGFQDQPELVARLRDEARLLGQLRHPAIVRAEDLVMLAGRLAVVMEYVPGVNLLQLLDPRRFPDELPPTVVYAVVRRVAEALDAAWNRPSTLTGRPLRVLHRDIKPSNIRLTPDGEVKVLDFGVARTEEMDRESSTGDELVGSFSYLAPEAFLQEPLGPCSDLYALGVVFYEALARRPFGRCALTAAGQAQRVEQRLAALDPAPLGPAAPQVLSLLRRMLDFDCERRPQAAEVAEQLRELGERAPGPSLEVWARRVVPRLQERGGVEGTGELVGRVFQDDSSVGLGSIEPEGEPDVLPAEEVLDEESSTEPLPARSLLELGGEPRRRRWTWPLLLLAVLLLGLGGALLLQLRGAGEPLPAAREGGERGAGTGAGPGPVETQAAGEPVPGIPAGGEPGGAAGEPGGAAGAEAPPGQGAAPPAEESPGSGGSPEAGARPAPAGAPESPAAAFPAEAAGGGGRGAGASAEAGPPRPSGGEVGRSAPAAGNVSPPADQDRTAPAPAAAEPVEVAFSSRPLGVALTVDGVYRGKTPLRLELEPGTHHLLFEDGGASAPYTIEVQPGGQKLWTFNAVDRTLR